MFEQFRKMIDSSDNIVFFGGAGVSTESGIPDFRSENGLYSAMTEYGMSPESIIEHDFFITHPDVFYDYYKKNLVMPNARPNNAHIALAELEKKGKLKAVITQNIDGLHQLAGSKNVFELHGSTLRYYCTGCGKAYDLDYIMDERHCRSKVPYCPDCGALIRPDIVLYNETLDEKCIEDSVNAIRQADMLIIGGTSLVVYPAAGFIYYYKGRKLVVINLSETGADDDADLVIHSPIGQVFAEAVLKK